MHESHMEPITRVSPELLSQISLGAHLCKIENIIWYVRLKISSIRNSMNSKYIDTSSLNMKIFFMNWLTLWSLNIKT